MKLQHISRIFWVAMSLFCAFAPARAATVFYVSSEVRAGGAGTEKSPWTLADAQQHVRALTKGSGSSIEVRLLPGVYELDAPLIFTSLDSHTHNAPVVWKAAKRQGGDRVVLSGGCSLGRLEWRLWRNDIWRAKVPDLVKLPEIFDQLFLNGERQVLARHPDYSAKATYLNGVAPDVDAPERVAGWKNPAGGYIHALHKGMWGGFHYHITGKNSDGMLALEGGWQNNRPEQGANLKMRYVEGVFEELDAPGEWFFDAAERMLYFHPPKGVDLTSDTVQLVAPRLESLVRFEGARNISVEGVVFAHTTRTFMKSREPLLRSDWRIYRGGAVFFEHAENCAVRNCDFEAPGGNAVFVNNRNKHIVISGCLIREAGASGIVFAGNPLAARSALFHYGETQALEKIDRTPGPASDDFPQNCIVSDCLITRTGRVEKQSAGVTIDLAARITVKDCSIYEVPRAGINIGDGCWGGHVIEGCDVFETVLETNDHGAFNSWGRDRFWERTRKITEQWVAVDPEMPFWDAREPNVLRGNRFRCDHGWDIDLDDGSTNYVIENNLCLSGGIKLREGYRRAVRNNITVNNGLHPHVWYPKSGDVVTNNIFFAPYAPVGMPEAWDGRFESNFLHVPGARECNSAVALQNRSHQDSLSLEGDAHFAAPEKGDYTITKNSPANCRPFAVDNFGVKSPRLRALARTPQIPTPAAMHGDPATIRNVRWDGAAIKELTTLAEQSAAGMASMTGVLVVSTGRNSRFEKFGVLPRDVILRWGSREIADVNELLAAAEAEPLPPEIEVWRDQETKRLKR